MATLPPVSNDQAHRQYQTRLLAYSTAIAVILVGVSVWYFAHHKQPTTNDHQTKGPVAVTPENFTDFIGTVTAQHDQQLTVTAIITNTNGQRKEQPYQVTVPADQVVKAVVSNGTTTYEPASLSDVATGQMIQVFGEKNLAGISSFTAKKVVLLPKS